MTFHYREQCSCGALVEYNHTPTLNMLTLWRQEHRHEFPPAPTMQDEAVYPWQNPLISYTGPTNGVLDVNQHGSGENP